ncbi:hypothetical protein DFJ73DRAFT_807570 [Zopfochytrium polystomum]|nr:hypothetical protein DFJ73DRAFT_807570 [Zopfochytrium polystomum]
MSIFTNFVKEIREKVEDALHINQPSDAASAHPPAASGLSSTAIPSTPGFPAPPTFAAPPPPHSRIVPGNPHHRNLVVCVDGTWQAPGTMADADSKGGIVQTPVIVPSNVVKLAYVFGGAEYPSNPGQKVYYHSGVATETDPEDKSKVEMQGMFGNIDDHVRDVYAWLAKEYAPGDEIYAFGFSRGSTIVRSLFSLIRYCGLVPIHRNATQNEINMSVNAAFNIYKLRGSVPDAEFAAKAAEFRASQAQPRLKFLGVFDTVEALEVPEGYTADKIINYLGQTAGYIEKNKFHDMRIGSEVVYAYHAMAIDETREYFPITLFEPQEPGATSLVREQKWFRGAHADVGGGFFEQGLSDISLQWMLSKAQGAGLIPRHGLDSFDKAHEVFLMGMVEDKWHQRKTLKVHDPFEKAKEGNGSTGKRVPRDLNLLCDPSKNCPSSLHESVFQVLLDVPIPPTLKAFLAQNFPEKLGLFRAG